MSDILAMANEVLAKRDLDGSQSRDEHSEDCAYIHPHCLIEGLVKEIARLREERRRLEEVWLACAKHTRLVYGGCFTPLPPGPETKAAE